MDTVSPNLPISLDGEVIRGRGACDAKGALAAMISASEELLARGCTQVGLLILVGEERDSDGAREAASLEIGSKYVVLGEPTNNTVATSQKGTLVFRVEASGKAAHSACAEKGRSAIHSLIKLINDWTSSDWGADPVIGPNVLNIGHIQGGVGANVVAPKAFAEGIFRIGTSLAGIRERLLTYESEDISIKVLSSSEPMQLFVPAGFKTSVASFGSDAPYLQSLGRIVMLGPGSIEHAHSPDEQITKSQLVSARELYVNLAQQLVGELE
jgi:acetylornithine deacetylase